jgi:putative DNA primase/helicase
MQRSSAAPSSPEHAPAGVGSVPPMEPSFGEDAGDQDPAEDDGCRESGDCPDAEDVDAHEPGETGLVNLGHADPKTGRIVLSPKRTLPSAHAYLRAAHAHEDGWTIVSFAGELLVWEGNRYQPLPEGGMERNVQRWLDKCLRYQINKRTQSMELVTFESNPGTVKAVIQTLTAEASLPRNVGPSCWLEHRAGDPPVRELLITPSKIIHLPTRKLIDPTPRLFATSSIEFEYDPDTPSPVQWLAFLDQCFGGDTERIRLLQQWFGYVLTSDTSQQKMLLIFGPRRSGKGTIGRVLAKIVGLGNIASPTVSSLAESFGLQPLLGKSLAIVSDARFSGQYISTVVERLLLISGEDPVSVSRKNTSAVETTLRTRFMFMTNELPRLADTSAALPGRMLLLETQQSFYGCEDIGLTGKLEGELPGILNWAIEGWRSLQASGRFTEPQASKQAAEELEDLASPVMQFVREVCVVGDSERVPIDTLYGYWKNWCEHNGREYVSNKQMFCRDLRAAVQDVERVRGTGNIGSYRGIGIRLGRAG